MGTVRADPVGSAPAPRDMTVDVAKGLAIIAIVAGHVGRGLSAAHLLRAADGYVYLDRWLYSWHLSVFALLSGIFVAGSVRKRGTVGYLRPRLVLFVYLYLVWSLLQGVVKILSPGVNDPFHPTDLLKLWLPDGQLWFLPWLFAMTTVAVMAAPWRSTLRGSLVCGLAALASIALWGLGGTVVFTQGWPLAVWYLLGTALGAVRVTASLARVPRGLAAVAGLALLCAAGWAAWQVSFTIPTESTGGRTVASVAGGVAVCCAATVGALLVARALSGLAGIGPGLAVCGRHSLEIFLAHIMATAGTRAVLAKLGVVAVPAQFVAGVLAGVLLPLLLVAVSDRLRVRWLFQLPAPLNRALTVGPR